MSTNRPISVPILVRTWARFRSGSGPETEQIPTRFWPGNHTVSRSDAGPEIEQFATRYWYGNVCISEPIPDPEMHRFRIRFRPKTVRLSARFWLGRGPNPCRALTRQHPNLDQYWVEFWSHHASHFASIFVPPCVQFETLSDKHVRLRLHCGPIVGPCGTRTGWQLQKDYDHLAEVNRFTWSEPVH